jgi:hypothetical protein
MLRGFLVARVIVAAADAGTTQAAAWKGLKARWRKESRLTAADLQAAYAGRLVGAGKRAALWAALGVHPSDFGVMLTDKAQQPPANWPETASGDDAPRWSPAAQAALEAAGAGS